MRRSGAGGAFGHDILAGRPWRVLGGKAAPAGFGNTAADAVDDGTMDLAVATFDQHIGHRFAQRSALRDGQKMLLALGGGVGAKGGVFETFRLAENGSRHLDVVVERQQVDQVRGRVCERARRRAISARASASTALRRRTMMSSNRPICSSE